MQEQLAELQGKSKEMKDSVQNANDYQELEDMLEASDADLKEAKI